MKINVHSLGKKYDYLWVFNNFDYEFVDGNVYAILGKNGSGKSTLLNILSSFSEPTLGKVEYFSNQSERINTDKIFQKIIFMASTTELPEELTLKELLNFYKKFKQPINEFSTQFFLDSLQIEAEENQRIQYYSSGMKQKIKVGLSFLFDSEMIFLDEPCTHLDETGVQIYNQLIKDYLRNRILIISSNNKKEYELANKFINIEEYKPKK